MPSREHDVAAVDDIPVDGMLGVKAGKQDVLLTRDRAAVYAVGGTCPHAGGTLAEGVRHDDHVICPWHKASFCLRTGGDPEKPELLAYYVKNGVVAAAAGLGRDRDTSALVALMSIQRDWTAEALGASPAALLGSQFASRSIRAE